MKIKVKKIKRIVLYLFTPEDSGETVPGYSGPAYIGGIPKYAMHIKLLIWVTVSQILASLISNLV